MKRLKTERELDDGYSRWVAPQMGGYYMACCDCGLVHHLQFRVSKVTKRYADGRKAGIYMPNRDYRVHFRAKRAPRYTAAQRKKK